MLGYSGDNLPGEVILRHLDASFAPIGADSYATIDGDGRADLVIRVDGDVPVASDLIL